MHCIFFFNELLFLLLFRHTSLDGSVKRAKRSKELSLFCGQNGYIPRKSKIGSLTQNTAESLAGEFHRARVGEKAWWQRIVSSCPAFLEVVTLNLVRGHLCPRTPGATSCAGPFVIRAPDGRNAPALRGPVSHGPGRPSAIVNNTCS